VSPPPGASWTVLGAGTILPRPGYGCSGHALRPAPGAPVTLFDCGPGTVRALAGSGIELPEVERVVLSHYHLDHCLDLLALAFARRSPFRGEVPPIELIGPVGLKAVLAGGERIFGRWVADPSAEVVEVEVGEGDVAVVELEGLELRCARSGHTDESVCWRADLSGGASAAYTGDAAELGAVSDLARGADLLVAECALPDESGTPEHLTPSSAARLAQRAGCSTLVLCHFYPPVDPVRARELAGRIFDGRIELARDGSVHAVE